MSAEWRFADTVRLYARVVSEIGPLQALNWRNSKRRDVYVSAPTSMCPLLVRGGSSDGQVFHQIFVEREYSCIDHLSDVRTIIDAGANVGYSSAYFLTRWPNAKVIALEPDPHNYAVLTRNLAPFGDRVTCLQVALWSESRLLDFRSGTMGAGAEWGRQVEASHEGTIEAVDIASLLHEYGLPTVDLLKVDIEGAEKAVFSSAPWLDRIKNIVIELHGDEAKEVFSQAIEDHRYDCSECGELSVCLHSKV